MTNKIDLLEALIEGEAKELRKQERKVKEKLDKTRARALERVEAQYNAELTRQNSELAEQKAKIDDTHYRRLAGLISVALEEDYSVMQARSSISEISERDMAKAQQILTIKEKVENVEDEGTRETLLAVIPLLEVNERVNRALEILSAGGIFQRNITSYIAAEKGTVYILSPVKEDKKRLAANLENRILETLDREEVIGEERGKVKFQNTDYDLANGFSLSKIILENPNEANKLAQFLKQRFEELQPEGFSDSKIKHEIRIVPIEAIDYFRKGETDYILSPLERLRELEKLGEQKISYKHAAEITGRNIRVLKTYVTQKKIELGDDGEIKLESLINYLAQNKKRVNRRAKIRKTDSEVGASPSNYDPERIRQEAYTRFLQISKGKEELTSSDIKTIFNSTSNSYATLLAQRLEIRPYVEKREEGRTRLYFKAEAIKKYIETRVPARNGKWIVKAKK